MDYRQVRARAGPEAFLGDYEGAMQVDGYAGYDHFEQVEGITLYGCWAHARRYFFKAENNFPERAEHALQEVKRLYAVERRLRESQASAAQRYHERQTHALPILQALKTWLEAHPGLPKSLWGKAVNYTLRHWDRLCRYTDNGLIEIDNNLVENLIRPITLGRKNYLRAGSHAGAKNLAVFYSFMGTCKLQGVNPQQWLTDVLKRIRTHPREAVHELLPHHWQRMRESRPP